jgi:DNA-binding NarL/FixJ family response regulator
VNPTVHAPDMNERQVSAAVGAGSETTVAMADAQAVLCESLAAYLKRQAGLRVTGSCGSIAGVGDLVDSTHPDVLLLDSELLADVGMEFIHTITSIPRGPSVILLMAREDRETTALAMQMGASACVLKQAPLDDLMTAIRSVAVGQMWMSPALLTAMFAEYRADSDQLRAREQLNLLTPRELQVLKMMVAGLSRSAIAERLHVSTNTARTHAQNLEKKLKVHSAVAAVSIALQAGLRPD